MFTGYTERELESGKYYCVPETSLYDRVHLWNMMRDHLDFAIMGRYNRAKASIGSLCSSRNQILRLFSDRYAANDFGPPQVEVFIAADGVARVTGFPIFGSPADSNKL